MKKVLTFTLLILTLIVPISIFGASRHHNTDTMTHNRCNTKVIAHRCYHENGANDAQFPENSLAAFKRAQELGVWGSEIDVWITPDDVVVVNHNSTVPTDKQGRKLEFTNYTDLQDIRLANGEPIPTLRSILQAMKDSDSDMNLVLEIKSHSKNVNNERVVNECARLIKEFGLEERVVWIAFSYKNCQRVVATMPGAMVMYLNGDKTPKTCLKDGIQGIDYHSSMTFKKYVRQAHKLGMLVNVWTVDSEQDMNKFLDRNVDYITTNEPDQLKELIAKRNK